MKINQNHYIVLNIVETLKTKHWKNKNMNRMGLLGIDQMKSAKLEQILWGRRGLLTTQAKHWMW